MTSKKTPETRKERFRAMSSSERKMLIRQKLKAQGLEEGSGIPEKNLSSYDREEIWGIIEITSCFPEMQIKKAT